MEDIAVEDLQVKPSDAANDDALSQCDEALIPVSSSSTVSVDPSSGPQNEIDFEKTGTVETEADKSASEDIEELPKLIETPEPEKSRKNGKFNLRKSLAWDNAFFTSDGVLDADELSTMIEGGEKAVKHQLPGIEEEVYKSMDSISTFESDNLSLDCLEAELFEDIRASIQKSNKSSNLNNSRIKVSSGKKDSQPNVNSSSKKVDLDSGKLLGARTKDNTSSIPQPKIINRLNLNGTSAITKRASLSANLAKKDQDTARKTLVAQKGNQIGKPTSIQGSKVTGVTGPRRAVPKPSISSKSSSSGSSTTLKTDHTRPSSSSSSCSSGTGVKVNISRKKVDTNAAKLTAGSIIHKTPSRISMDKKQPPVNSNISSSISPASSISDRSVESRCSSIETSVSYRSFDGDTSVHSALSFHPTPQFSNQSGNQIGSGLRPPAVQPTGLRMPSPKIGFFDGGKTGVRTPTGGIRSQSRLPNGPTSSNDAKFGKLPPPKTALTRTNIKLNPQKTSSKASQEQPTSKPKTKSRIVTSDVSDPNSEASLNICLNPSDNMDKDLNKQPNSRNNDFELYSDECIVVGKDDNKSVTDGSRTPFAVKNSVSDAHWSGIEVTEKSANIPFMETQQNENSEIA